MGFKATLIHGVNMHATMRHRVYQTGSRLCIAAGILLATTGCKVGPDYQRPELASVPETFRAVDDPSLRPVPGDHRTWWIVFDDPTLNSLIQRAAEHNLDLRLAISRVNEARARTRIAESQRAPQLSLGGGYGGISNASTGFETRSNATLGIEASWELDVFGRIARQIEAADAIFQATEEDRRDVQVSLFAEVARAYLSVRSLQAQLDAASQNITSQQDILGLTRTRFRDGIASALEIAQASELLATSEAAVPSLRIDLSREINTIALLVGTHPDAVHAELSEPRPVPVPEVEVAVGVPADLIRQRPDIRAAERRLAAQSAQVGSPPPSSTRPSPSAAASHSTPLTAPTCSTPAAAPSASALQSDGTSSTAAGSAPNSMSRTPDSNSHSSSTSSPSSHRSNRSSPP